MIPFLIGGVLVILFIASRVVEDTEPSWSWRRRVGVMACVLALLVADGLLTVLAMASS